MSSGEMRSTLHLIRFGKKPEEVKLSSLRAIRAKCLDCSTGPAEATRCLHEDCTLHYFRSGHNPRLKGKGGKGNIEALQKWMEKGVSA